MSKWVQCLWQAVQIQVQQQQLERGSQRSILHRVRRSEDGCPAGISRHEDVSNSRAVANHRSDDLDIALNPDCPEGSRATSIGLRIRDGPVGGLTPGG